MSITRRVELLKAPKRRVAGRNKWPHAAREAFAQRLALRRWARIYWPEAA